MQSMLILSMGYLLGIADLVRKLPTQRMLHEDFLNNHSFLWDRDFLVEYLKDNEEIYLFGVSGNIYDMLDLFDRVYFIKIDPNTQKERLMHDSRENPMGNTKFQRDNAVAWGEELEEKAKELNIQFIDGSLTPEEMINIIKS